MNEYAEEAISRAEKILPNAILKIDSFMTSDEWIILVFLKNEISFDDVEDFITTALIDELLPQLPEGKKFNFYWQRQV